MESDELQQSLHEAERGEASTWIDYPPTPRWWAPMFGVWSVLLAANLGYVGGIASSLITLVLAAFMGGVIGWQRRVRGTFPTGRPPKELRRSMLLLFGGAAVIGAVCWVLGALVAVWLAVVLAGSGAWALVDWYERAYARDAVRVRLRLQ